MPFIQQQLISDGITAEGRIIVPKSILECIINDQVLTLVVGSTAGTGYAVGDTGELSTGTAVAVNAASFTMKYRVTAEAGGAVTGLEIISAGAYTADPTLTNGGTTVLTGAGDGAMTATVTMQTNRWTQDESDYTDLTTAFEFLCTSVKATNKPTIGIRTRLSASNDGMQLICASGYDSGSVWLNQPGAPPTNEFYCAIPNVDPEIFISITERRVNVLVTDDGRNDKQYCGMGLFIPYVDVAGNYPFPGFVHGNQRSVRAFTESYNQSDFTGGNAGICNPMDMQSGILGCYQYRHNLSSEWRGISHNNNNGADTAHAQIWPAQHTSDTVWSFNHAPVPSGSSASAANMNPFTSTRRQGSMLEDDTQSWFNTDASTKGAQGPAPLGTGSQLHFTVQPHIIANQLNDVQVIGFVDGWENIHGRGLAAFEEIETASGQRYIVFNDTDTTALYRWVAMEIL